MKGETHLTNDIHDEDFQFNFLTFQRCDHQGNVSRGGVCVYYRSDLPISPKPELIFLDECIVIVIRREKWCFITCLYRSPADNSSKMLMSLLLIWKKLLATLKNVIHVSFIVGYFNGKNTNCWANINDYKGIQIEQISGAYGYSQIINEATNFEPHSEPSVHWVDILFPTKFSSNFRYLCFLGWALSPQNHLSRNKSQGLLSTTSQNEDLGLQECWY